MRACTNDVLVPVFLTNTRQRDADKQMLAAFVSFVAHCQQAYANSISVWFSNRARTPGTIMQHRYARLRTRISMRCGSSVHSSALSRLLACGQCARAGL